MWSDKHFRREMKRVKREKKQCDRKKELYDKRLEVKLIKRSMRSFKFPTTTKIIVAYIFLNCTVVEIYSMVVMWKLQNLDALYALITAVVAESVSFAVYAAKSYLKSLAGTYATTDKLNMRNGAGTGKKIMVTIPKGTTVKNYGYYTNYNGTKWLSVQVTIEGTKYTGFCSEKYLKRL